MSLPTSVPAASPLPKGISHLWSFTASSGERRPVNLHERKEALLSLRPAPAHRAIKAVTPYQTWTVYFVYLPHGQLTESHHFTLKKLRALKGGLLVVCACPTLAEVPAELHKLCDALYWKGLSGYDFSAYKLALGAIARHSPKANVFVMNDSVFGPFHDLAPLIHQAPWDLTGFTASSQIENHIQSYAFVLKDVTPSRLRKLASVFLPLIAFSRPFDAIEYQETRLAKVAARCMTVGAYWFADASQV